MTNKPNDKKQTYPINQPKEDDLFDKYSDMQFLDDIPLDELNDPVKNEKNKDHSKDTSSSERRYP